MKYDLSQPSQTRQRVRRSLFDFLFNRLTISAAMILLQVCCLFSAFVFFQGKLRYVYSTLQVVSAVVIIWLIRKPDNPAYKIAWAVIILLLKPFGALFYLLWGNTPFNRSRLIKIRPIDRECIEAHHSTANRALHTSLPHHRKNCEYLNNIAEVPAWQNTNSEFFPCGEYMFQAMLLDLKKAKQFIFMEYFIIDRGLMWDSILEILAEKAAAGVDVRVMYDDVGCISTLPRKYTKYLQSLGIKAMRFNKFIPTLNTYFNYRDHRKICVIDGNIGYTGGINLADEYINKRERFGYWKDTGIRLYGQGVANFTALFLQLWDFTMQCEPTDITPYLPTISANNDGFVQSFSDSPLDNFNVSETVYMNIINNATKSVYITSPYLTLDNEMITALCTAAQSGIDVRIVTPGIPDKKSVYYVTRSYYAQLIHAGVRIYEYTPGFLHAKMIVADHDIAVVGTINMDFRSFYLHFECGTVFYRGSIIDKVRNDILNTIKQSQEIDEAWLESYPWIKSIAASVLSLFAPLI